MKCIRTHNKFENIWWRFELQKTHSNFKILERTLSTSALCMTKDFNNIVKWLQILRSPISWTPKHNYKLWINNSSNKINGDFPKYVNAILSISTTSLASFYYECTHCQSILVYASGQRPTFCWIGLWRCMWEHMVAKGCCHLGLLVWCLAKWQLNILLSRWQAFSICV